MYNPFNPKPKCFIEVKKGRDDEWRWYARSLGAQTVNRIQFAPDELIAGDDIVGDTSAQIARNRAGAAMRGWKITRTDVVS